MSLGSSRNHLSYFPYYLVQSTIFISLSTFEDQSVLRDSDPPYTRLIRVLVSRYKRVAFVIEIRDYLLQGLPTSPPSVKKMVSALMHPEHSMHPKRGGHRT